MSTVLGCCPNFNRECFNTQIFASIAVLAIPYCKLLKDSDTHIPDVQFRIKRDGGSAIHSYMYVQPRTTGFHSSFLSIQLGYLLVLGCRELPPKLCGRRRLPIIDQVMLRVDFRAAHGRNFRMLLFRHPSEFVLTFDSYSLV